MQPKLSFSTLACPTWSWHEVLQHGAEYGFAGVEVRMLRGETDLLRLEEFKAAQLPARRAELQTLNFQVCGLASSVRFDYPDSGALAQQVAIGRDYIHLAHELGAGFVRVFGDVLPPIADPAGRKEVASRISAGLQQLGDYGAECGVQVVMETHGDFADSRLMQEMLRNVAHPSVGVLWDTHHPWRFFGEDPRETFARLQPWIRHTHWKDSSTQSRKSAAADAQAAEHQASSLMSGHRPADYVLFGSGEFPAEQCLACLKGAGYDGWFSLEWEKAWHPEIEPPEIALPPFPEKLTQLWRSSSRSGTD